MKNILIALAVLILAGAAYYFLVIRPAANETELLPPPVIEQPAAAMPSEAESTATALHPGESESAVPEAQQAPLPALADSDPEVAESAAELVGQAAVAQQLVTENIVARVVATVDALTGRQVSPNLLPLQPPAGALQVTEDTDSASASTTAEGYPVREYLLDPVNYRRYTPYVELLESVDTEQLLADYKRYEPLFQQAYAELGYPEGDFSARLLEVIDHLLDAPEASGPIRLVKPEAYYLFTDPQLEALTAGQKLMIRMGGDNAQRVKKKLAEIRAALDAAHTIN